MRLACVYPFKLCRYRHVRKVNRNLTTGTPKLHPIAVKEPWYMIGIDFVPDDALDGTNIPVCCACDGACS